MTNILIIGRTGRMGKLVEESAIANNIKVIGGVSAIQNDLSSSNPDIIIDFSTPEVLMSLLHILKEKKIPLISGTTGLSEDQINILKEASKSFPIMHSTNFSVGVNTLFSLAELGAKMLKDAEVEIIEKHHRYKKDSPSGTAVTIGEIVADAKSTTLEESAIYGRSGLENVRKDEIAFHAVRGGNIIGEHSLQFILDNELVEIRHEALNRRIFADGAISGIPFLLKQVSGFFHIKDALNLNNQG